MSNETQKINKVKQLSRALEVINLFGVKLPDNFDVNQGRINLSNNSSAASENYIKFDNERITIILERNGHRYYWHTFSENEFVQEELVIDCHLVVAFYLSPIATTTSCFYLYNDNWGSPKIYSDLVSVSMGFGENKQVFSIDDYYDVVTSYMKGKKANSEYCALANDPAIIDIILKMYENPIKQHIADLKSNDQSQRISIEEAQIQSEYSRRVKENNKIYANALRTAENELQERLRLAEGIKNDSLSDLKDLQKEYGSEKGLILNK